MLKLLLAACTHPVLCSSHEILVDIQVLLHVMLVDIQVLLHEILVDIQVLLHEILVDMQVLLHASTKLYYFPRLLETYSQGLKRAG